MENIYTVIDSKNHKCKVLNLVWNEATHSYSVYNVSKNNVEMRREFDSKKAFEQFLDERKESGLIDNYYEVDM